MRQKEKPTSDSTLHDPVDGKTFTFYGLNSGGKSSLKCFELGQTCYFVCAQFPYEQEGKLIEPTLIHLVPTLKAAYGQVKRDITSCCERMSKPEVDEEVRKELKRNLGKESNIDLTADRWSPKMPSIENFADYFTIIEFKGSFQTCLSQIRCEIDKVSLGENSKQICNSSVKMFVRSDNGKSESYSIEDYSPQNGYVNN